MEKGKHYIIVNNSEAVEIPSLSALREFSLLVERLLASDCGHGELQMPEGAHSNSHGIHLKIELAHPVSVQAVQVALAFVTHTGPLRDKAVAAMRYPWLSLTEYHFYYTNTVNAGCAGMATIPRFLHLMGELMEIGTYLDMPSLKRFVRALLLRVMKDGDLDCLIK